MIWIRLKGLDSDSDTREEGSVEQNVQPQQQHGPQHQQEQEQQAITQLSCVLSVHPPVLERLFNINEWIDSDS